MRAAANVVRRPTLTQLHHFVQQVEQAASIPLSSPTPPPSRHPSIRHLLSSSSAFLSSYLPPRLYQYHHAHHYHHYHPSITSLPSFSALSHCFHRLSRGDEWTLTGGGGGSSDADLSKFSAWSRDCMEELETVVRTVTHELRDLIRSTHRPPSSPSPAPHPPLQVEVDRLLNRTYSLLIEMRLHLSHYAYADAVYRQLSSHPTQPCDAQQLALDFPVVTRCDLRAIAERCVDNARGACVEKHGDAPAVEVVGGESAPVTMVAVPAHLHFILFEVLKNAMKAVIDAEGVLQLHEAEPIQVHLSASGPGTALGPAVGLRVTDRGVGLAGLSPASALFPSPASLFHYFYTTSQNQTSEEGGDDWRYSRQFGSPFSGLGVGLPLVRLYSSEVYGGGVSVAWVPGTTETFVVLNQLGRVELGRSEH